ncbi:MAG: hypothetical protein RJA76_1437 [Bacteroidota bacterium]|jgi:nitrite reductase/ring-hydroxylating ferredoxin subunit
MIINFLMEKKYSRFQFLKAVGFTGPALLAALSSCTQNEDFNVDSLVLNSNGESVADLNSTSPSAPSSGATPGGTTGGSTGSTTGGTTGGGTTVNALAKIDLNSSTASNLKNAGGYIIVNNLYVIGKTANGNYVAASNLCTHEPKRRVIFNKTEFYCTDHGARFSLTGQTLTTIARSNLTVYKTQVDGTILTIY